MSDLTATHGASTAFITTPSAREHVHQLLGQRSVRSCDGSWTQDGFVGGVPMTRDPAAS